MILEYRKNILFLVLVYRIHFAKYEYVIEF